MTAKEIKAGIKVVKNADAELDADDGSSCQKLLASRTHSFRAISSWKRMEVGRGRERIVRWPGQTAGAMHQPGPP
jgi:hypothetical protein